MELHEPKDHENELRRKARHFSEIVRVGTVFMAWGTVAFVAGCGAFIVIKVAWKFLVLILKAIGEI
jgi:hypothetical protein